MNSRNDAMRWVVWLSPSTDEETEARVRRGWVGGGGGRSASVAPCHAASSRFCCPRRLTSAQQDLRALLAFGGPSPGKRWAVAKGGLTLSRSLPGSWGPQASAACGSMSENHGLGCSVHCTVVHDGGLYSCTRYSAKPPCWLLLLPLLLLL